MLLPGHPLWLNKRTFPDLKLPELRAFIGGTVAEIREGHTKKVIQIPSNPREPLVISYGMGTDSSALLVLLVAMKERRSLPDHCRPQLIQFADVGSEKPETYAYVAKMDEFLLAHGFPKTTVVSKAERGKSKHDSLHGQCLTLATMPSLAYGGKSCSIKWKVTEMDFQIARWLPAQIAWAEGGRVHKMIGYDASPADLRRSTNPGDEKFQYHYPLRDCGLTRPKLIRIIEDAGLPQPGKSACFMCPASKRPEVEALARNHPDLCGTALRMEAAAILRSLQEQKPMTTVGLGRSWNWREYLSTAHPDLLARLERETDCGTAEWLGIQAELAKRGARACEVVADVEALEEVLDEEDCGAG